jgi:DNA-binding MarR family transcriptional regulator
MSEPVALPEIVEVITRAFAQMQARALREGDFAELSLRQISCLDLIQRLEEPTPSNLARELGITKPSVSALVARLLATGFIRKERSHADGRSFHLHLTGKGIEMMHAHQRVHEALAQHLLAGLDERQQVQLVALLTKVTTALSDQRSETLPAV